MHGGPIILLAAGEELTDLTAEFAARYARDYRLETADDAADGLAVLRTLVDEGAQVAMIAAAVDLDGTPGWEFLRSTQAIVPTARRVALVAPGPAYVAHLEPLRQASARRDIDTFLGIPRGARDEEFHGAVTELLSEWGWSVARPTVSMVDVVAPAGDREAHVIRDLLERLGVPHRLHAPDSVEGAETLALAAAEQEAAARPGASIPQVAMPVVRSFDGRVVSGATAARVNELMYGGFDAIPEGAVADVVIVGAGPAGLAAAVYAASEGLKTAVLERDAIGGQAGSSSMIRNYLGFPRGISGMRLAQRSRIQASRFGARFFTGRAVTGIEPCLADGVPSYRVRVGDAQLTARTVLLSTGVAYRRLGLPALDDLVGAGVFYGAATGMAREMQGRDVIVVGGGNSAGQAAVHLAKFATRVTILIRRPDLSATMSDYLIREIEATPAIQVVGDSEIVDGGGEGRLEWVTLRNRVSGEDHERSVDGVFCMLGAEPDCSWLPAGLALDERGYVLTGRDVPRETWVDGMPPADLETTLPGIFAAGDVRSRSMKRVASASGEGASVLPLIHGHLARLAEQPSGEG